MVVQAQLTEARLASELSCRARRSASSIFGLDLDVCHGYFVWEEEDSDECAEGKCFEVKAMNAG